jgi:L-lysine exporter family protein LysE/ArgO
MMEKLFLEGLLLQASLIFALGAQNIFVLESGIKKHHSYAISFACFFCDFILIMIGVAGAGALVSSFLGLKILIGFISALFLFHFGIKKIFSPIDSLQERNSQDLRPTLKQSLLLAVTFSVVNPHAYLDAFILIGGYTSKYALLVDRLWVGAGAACFSLIWFLTLSSATRIMHPLFSRQTPMKIISVGSGSLLLLLSFRLSQDIYSWILASPHPQFYANFLK